MFPKWCCFADSGKWKQSRLPLKENSTFSNWKTQGSSPAGSTWMPVVYLATELQSMRWKIEKTLHLNSPSMAYTPQSSESILSSLFLAQSLPKGTKSPKHSFSPLVSWGHSPGLVLFNSFTAAGLLTASCKLLLDGDSCTADGLSVRHRSLCTFASTSVCSLGVFPVNSVHQVAVRHRDRWARLTGGYIEKVHQIPFKSIKSVVLSHALPPRQWKWPKCFGSSPMIFPARNTSKQREHHLQPSVLFPALNREP